MDKNSISMLAKLLRDTGDKVLQGEKTLCLNDTLLTSLTDSFKFLVDELDCDASFLVAKTNNSKEIIFQDIQFLHDFIQKVVNLSIIKDPSKSSRKSRRLDINKFKSLKTLEVTRIPIHNICGIQQVRAQLQCVICSHSLQQLKDLLVKCGADNGIACIWEKLNEVIFSHNALGGIDNSFHYAPLLQIIDLSHNRLKNFSVEDCLPNLKNLNLSFNLLQSIPALGKEGSCRLKVLLLRNNFLKDLSGLTKLKNLAELDLACNSLIHHSTLAPLAALPLLNCVNLVGNPLSFCYKHRANTVQYLHLNTARCMFSLDGLVLSWREKRVVRRWSEQRLAAAAAAAGPLAAAAEGQGEGEGGASDLLRSVDSSFSTDSAYARDDEDFNSPVVQIRTKRSLRSKRQRQLVKEAVIAESHKEQEETLKYEPIGSDQEHLQVKQHVEQLRQRFGEDNWLSEHGATHLQAVLGLPQVAPPSFIDTLAQQSEPEVSACSHEAVSPRAVESSLPLEKTEQHVPSNVNIHHMEDSERNEILSSEKWEEEEIDNQVAHCESEEEDLDERKLFTVRKENSSELFLLAVSTHRLQERGVESGKVLQQWDLATLESCELLSDDQSAVRLTFTVLQRDRRSRVYFMESSEAKLLLQLLGEVLASRSLSEMNQVAYRCMKCSTQFSQEEDVRFASRESTVLCPNCKSRIVCMMEETPLPTTRVLLSQPPEPAVPINLTQPSTPLGPSLSSSQSSIGSKDNCFPSAATGSTRDCYLEVAAIVHQADAPSASPSHPSPPLASSMASAPALMRSAVSLEENITSALNTRRCDSDIEVISNPSQSSIEVIDGESRTPGRKRSSEERQPILVSSDVGFKPSSNPAIPSLGLTESSSSGSFTDSICTTYETQRTATNGPLNGKQSPAEQQQNCVNTRLSMKNTDESVAEVDEEEVLYGTGPVPSLQEMFEGLLEKVDKKLATSANLKPVTNVVDNSLHYSYSDFQHVDHRLRLFFLQELLDSNEELLMVLRADALKSDVVNPFPSLLVFSTEHFWLLEIIGPEGDNPESWLQENLKSPISCVNGVFSLPWAQGVGLLCRNPDKHVLMLLQDSQRTNNFLRAAETLLPETCGVVNEIPNYNHQFLSRITCSNSGDPESQIQLLSLFNSFNIEGEELSVKYGVFTVRTADIFVTESNFSWIFPNTCDTSTINTVAAQKISDLMEVVTDGCRVGLHFIDETRHKEAVWNMNFQTAACVQAVVVAVRTPWEQLFSVPLQVTESNQR